MSSTRRFQYQLGASVGWLSWRGPLITLAMVGPLLLLISLIIRDHVEIPFWDQWDLARLLTKHHQEGLSFGDFWAQHNEHRLLLPRLLMWLMALATGWRIGFEIALNVVLATAVLGLLSWQLRQTRRQIPTLNCTVLMPLLAFLHFAYSQAENWLWGWQIAVFLNLLAVVSSILLLCRPTLSGRVCSLGFAFAVVAIFSFGTGALAFGLGVLPLFQPTDHRRNRAVKCLLWGIGALLVIGSYLYGFVDLHTDAGKLDTLANAERNLVYVLVFLGNPVAGGDITVATWAGVGGLLWFGGTTVYLVFIRRMPIQVLLPYLSLGCYAIASAALIASGRSHLGVHQATGPRYILFSNLLWLADLILLFMVFAVARNRVSSSIRWVLVGGCLAIGAGVINSTAAGLRYGERHRTRLATVRDDILSRGPDRFDPELFKWVYPRPEKLRDSLRMMEEHGYSLFAKKDGR